MMHAILHSVQNVVAWGTQSHTSSHPIPVCEMRDGRGFTVAAWRGMLRPGLARSVSNSRLQCQSVILVRLRGQSCCCISACVRASIRYIRF